MSTRTNIFYVDFSTFYQGDQTTTKCNLYFFLEQYLKVFGDVLH